MLEPDPPAQACKRTQTAQQPAAAMRAPMLPFDVPDLMVIASLTGPARSAQCSVIAPMKTTANTTAAQPATIRRIFAIDFSKVGLAGARPHSQAR